jgi:general secretion pathway protein K
VIRAPKSAGYALVLVLWMIALLSLTVATSTRSQRVETTLANIDHHDARARALAESGIWLALADFLAQEAEAAPSFRASFEDAEIAVRIRPANTRIDLNAADASMLDALLRSVSVGAEERADLVDRIVDWRDADDERSARGLENRDYASLSLDYSAKNAPFYTVDELRYVPGVTEALFRRVGGALTVFGGDSSVDVALADRDVLLALPGVDSAEVERMLARRAGAAAPKVGAGRSGIFELTATVTAGQLRARTVAIVQIARGSSPPYRVLSWTSANAAAEAP